MPMNVPDKITVPDHTMLREALVASMPLPVKLEPQLEQTLLHVLEHPGSLVRPRIVFQMAAAYGAGAAEAQELAVALEYFHTASLLFDDLPCMDDAAERRGAMCAHLAFGEAGAMLAALALINRAYGLTWRAVSCFAQERQGRALAYIEELLGVGGLLNGQSLDLHYATLPQDQETTERIAIGKTVSLIRLTLVLPALLGGASEEELALLERIAHDWGISYQIVDDLKDVLQGSDESGKTGERDLSLGRPNIALAIGIPAAVERLTCLIQRGQVALDDLVPLRPGVGFLTGLRADLQEEADRVIASACAMTMTTLQTARGCV